MNGGRKWSCIMTTRPSPRCDCALANREPRPGPEAATHLLAPERDRYGSQVAQRIQHYRIPCDYGQGCARRGGGWVRKQRGALRAAYRVATKAERGEEIPRAIRWVQLHLLLAPDDRPLQNRPARALRAGNERDTPKPAMCFTILRLCTVVSSVCCGLSHSRSNISSFSPTVNSINSRRLFSHNQAAKDQRGLETSELHWASSGTSWPSIDETMMKELEASPGPAGMPRHPKLTPRRIGYTDDTNATGPTDVLTITAQLQG